MNSRVLKRKQKSPYQLSDNEKVEIEDEALMLDNIVVENELNDGVDSVA